MKRVFLLMFVSALLVTFGFAQTPDAGSNTAPASVKGCLGGSAGNYTVAEDGTRQILKITANGINLAPYLGQDVQLIGQKASGALSSGADNTFAVTQVTVISEHCGTAAVAPAATISPSAATVGTPAVDAAEVPATPATVSPTPATVTPPAVDTAALPATVSPDSAGATAPAVDAVPPASTVGPSSATVHTSYVDAAPPARPSAHPRRIPATKAAVATLPDETVTPSDTVIPTADTATPAAVSPSPEAVSPPAAVTTTPAVTHRPWSLVLLISFVVLVVVLGTLAPLIGRWRKRKMLERTGVQNLSFTNDTVPDQDKPEEPRKAA